MKRSNNAITPTSSIDNPADSGLLAHTNIQVLTNYQILRNVNGTPQASGSPFPGFYEDPASLACIYLFQLLPQVSGCNPSSALPNPSGGARAIAVVDAYDDPSAYADLQVFTEVFGVQAITPAPSSSCSRQPAAPQPDLVPDQPPGRRSIPPGDGRWRNHWMSITLRVVGQFETGGRIVIPLRLIGCAKPSPDFKTMILAPRIPERLS
jgi:hypothetical protein